ncbi:MAG TPA: hypothetical protein VGQ59_19395 [Cyclobacteriaceae bacterium]|nr:hypothetical protein [Cyclobacteriaceae bacterium]
MTKQKRRRPPDARKLARWLSGRAIRSKVRPRSMPSRIGLSTAIAGRSYGFVGKFKLRDYIRRPSKVCCK